MLHTVKCPKCGNAIRVWQTAGGAPKRCHRCGFDGISGSEESGLATPAEPMIPVSGPATGCIAMGCGCSTTFVVLFFSLVTVPLLWQGAGWLHQRDALLLVLSLGSLVTAGWLSVTAEGRRRKGRSTGNVMFVSAGAMVCSGVLLLALGLLPVSRAREPARMTQCRNNLYQLAIALRNYEETYGVFPPAVTYGPDGQAMHGWGVNLLPFIEETPLSKKYDPTKPWDDPANAEVVNTYLVQFECPSGESGAGADNHTHYRMVVCPGSIGGVGKSAKLKDITDGPEQTIFLVECAEPVPWASPEAVIDLRYGFPETIHEQGLFAAFADGHVRFLSENMDHLTLLGLCTAAGGEKIDDKDY